MGASHTNLGYYRAPGDLKQCSVSLDLESIRRDSPYNGANSPTACEEETRSGRREKKIKVYDRRIIALSGVVMTDGDTPNNAQVHLGSLPHVGCQEPLSEQDLLYLTAYTLLGVKAENDEDLQALGVDTLNLQERAKKSGLPPCFWPVIIGAYTSGDMSTLFAGFTRAGLVSNFCAAPGKDRSEDVANPYVNSLSQSKKKVDLLDIARANGGLPDIPSLDDLAMMHGLPGKYLPEENSSVDKLWQQGRIEDIVEYNRVDALNTHFLNLYYLRFDQSLTSEDFGRLWRRSAKLLEQQAQQKGDVGLKWFLKELPGPEKLNLIRLRPRSRKGYRVTETFYHEKT